MQVLQVQQTMAAQAQTKQTAAEAAIQPKTDAEVAKRTNGLPVHKPSSPAKTKGQPTKTDDVAPNDDGFAGAGRLEKFEGAKRRKKHAERAGEVAVLAGPLAVFEDAFEQVTRVAAMKKSSGYASEDSDDTRPSKSPDSELCIAIAAVQH